jgi:polar amino acid transport system substrate-binding protein
MKVGLLLLLVTLNLAKAEDKVIKILSDPWCPFACKEDDKKLGAIIDISKLILEKSGYKLIYKNVNYARAINETRAGVNDAVAGCAREDAPDFVFPSEMMSKTVYQYYKKNGSSFQYKDINSLKGKKIGVINGYTYDVETTEQVARKNPSFIVVSGNLGLSQLLQMLESNRIDALVESDLVFKNHINDQKIPTNKFQFAGAPEQKAQELFLCFTPKKARSKVIVKLLSDGMKQIRKSGELKVILDKYQMKDWN